MEKGFVSVPFTIDDNFTKIAGIGKFSPAGIVLEYEGKIFGIIKSGVKESRIALEDILDVKFKKGTFKLGAKIEIRLRSFEQLAEMPNKDGKITLKLERGDFERGEKAIERLNNTLKQSEANLPPVKTSVTRLFNEENGEDGE